ncbi:MAG TPA: hypothetical protein VK401_11880, partial [Propionibacteriaceae bacterium]|nr:hypothetical protein [Propionibacteriaceae bacterium]
GLIYCEYLTGSLPAFDAATYHEAAVAVRNGETLRMPRTGVPPVLADLVDEMLLADPASRPTTGRVHSTLMAFRPAVAPADTPTAAPTALRGKGLRTTLRRSGAESGSSGRLVGKLVQRLTDRTTK